ESSSQELCLSCTHPSNKHVCEEHLVSNNSSLVASPFRPETCTLETYWLLRNYTRKLCIDHCER
ncbi:unnamed protein product, partial [Sphagnum jensenii]